MTRYSYLSSNIIAIMTWTMYLSSNVMISNDIFTYHRVKWWYENNKLSCGTVAWRCTCPSRNTIVIGSDILNCEATTQRRETYITLLKTCQHHMPWAFLCSIILSRDECSVCWHWWNSEPSLLKLSCHNRDVYVKYLPLNTNIKHSSTKKGQWQYECIDLRR